MDDDAGIRIAQLERRLARLEADVRFLSAGGASERVAPTPASAMPPPPTSDSTRPPWSSDPPVARTVRVPRSFEVESERALRWAGVGLVVLAVGFAVSTAISRGWIGPELQLLGATSISLTLIGAGLQLRPTRISWAHALCSGGLLALFSTVASSLFLEQFDETVGYACTVGIGLAGYLLARRVPSQWVAAASLSGSIVGWLVIADGDAPFLASLGWVSLAVALAIIVSIERPWFVLRVVAHVAGAIGGLAFAISADGALEEVLVVAGAGLLFASIAWVPSLGRGISFWRELEIQFVIFGPPWAFLVLTIALDVDGERPSGAVAALVATASVAVALALRSILRQEHLVSLLVGASATLSIGLALMLSSTETFLALSVQAVGLVILARFLQDKTRVLVHAAVLAAIVVALVVGNLLTTWSTDASFGDDVVRAVTIVVLALGAWQSRRQEVHQIGAVAVLTMTLLWLGSVLVHLPQGQALVSLSWAIVGTIVLAAGAMRKVPALGAAGLGVIAITVGKLLTIDLREVDTLWRAALFFVIGVGIMRLGFLLPHLTGSDGNEELEQELPDSHRPDDLASVG